MSKDEWINKVWYGHSMEYYSAMKRDEVLIAVTTWMNLENVVFSERSQTPKATYAV